MAIRVYLNRDELIREARHLSTPQRVEVAHEFIGEAKADATVLTGDYRDGMHVEVDGDNVKGVDDDPDAFYKEYGTSDTPAHAAMTEAAKRQGKYTGFQPKG